uniref:Zgc:86896 n=1 Tax=Neolamprologus brichardi TaxID=32507 RepID=A0A3Q4GCI5_NEOBR
MTLYHFTCLSVRVIQLTSDSLPLLSVLYISPTEIVAAGHDCCPYQYTYKGPRSLEFVKKLDIPKQTSKGNMSAMQHFRNLDKKATDEETSDLDALHQNSITQLRIVSLGKAKVVQYSSVGLDGAMVIWDFKVLRGCWTLAPPGPLTTTSRQRVKCLAQGHND